MSGLRHWRRDAYQKIFQKQNAVRSVNEKAHGQYSQNSLGAYRRGREDFVVKTAQLVLHLPDRVSTLSFCQP